MANMTNAQLIAALQQLDPNAVVEINISQDTQVRGVVRVPVHFDDRFPYECVNGSGRGCTINASLPEKAYIAKLPKL